jgi:hypothetical protein
MDPFISFQVNSDSFFNNYDEYIKLNIISIYINRTSTDLSLALKNIKITNKISNFDISYEDDNTNLVLTNSCDSNLPYNDRFEFIKNELFNLLNKNFVNKNDMFGIIYTSNGNLKCYKNTCYNIINFL